MRSGLAGAACVLVLVVSSPAPAQPRLLIKGAAAHVTVIPEPRRDIQVTQVRRNPDLALQIRRDGDSVVVDGGLGKRVHGCARNGRGSPGVRVRGLGVIADGALPLLVVRAPMDVRLATADGVNGEVGRAHSLDLQNRGCGDWTIANVRGRLGLVQVGPGVVRTGAAGVADLSVAEGGEIKTGPVSGSLIGVSSGESAITATSVEGTIVARVAGSGRVVIRAGRSRSFNASVAGSGRIEFDGLAGSVTASVTGPGVVSVAHASGPVVRKVFGSGVVRVGR